MHNLHAGLSQVLAEQRMSGVREQATPEWLLHSAHPPRRRRQRATRRWWQLAGRPVRV